VVLNDLLVLAFKFDEVLLLKQNRFNVINTAHHSSKFLLSLKCNYIWLYENNQQKIPD